MARTGFEFDYQGTTGVIVGYHAAFPHHPDPGTQVHAFPDLHPATEAALFALVSVEWATPLHTVDLGTSALVATRYLRGFGTPTAVTWNLRPVTRAENGCYLLAAQRYAAGPDTAAIPTGIGAHVRGVPAQVAVHDHRIN